MGMKGGPVMVELKNRFVMDLITLIGTRYELSESSGFGGTMCGGISSSVVRSFEHCINVT